MKKILPIFLLVCFALYHFGYYAFYFSYDRHLEGKWEAVIYGESQLEVQEKLIEIPLSMPYMANQEEFQPTNTPYEKDGKYYRVIKQRYQNDTLQLIVLPDTERRVLDSTVKKWISLITEDEVPQDQNGSVAVKFFVKDYIQPSPFDFMAYPNTVLDSSMGYLPHGYISPACRIDSPPPQFS